MPVMPQCTKSRASRFLWVMAKIILPKDFTFFTSPFGEKELLQWAYVFEKLTHRREPPKNYSE